MYLEIEPTPLERDHALHKAFLFDRDLVKINSLILAHQREENELLKTALQLRIEDMVCSDQIMWPAC